MSCVLGIDPGTRKVGYAVVDADGVVLTRGIEALADLPGRIAALAAGHPIDTVALGGGTNVGPVRRVLECTDLRVALVDEHETTLGARTLYFSDHPPRGWRRLIPRGMLLPPCPVDDYAAILIARRWLAELS